MISVNPRLPLMIVLALLAAQSSDETEGESRNSR